MMRRGKIAVIDLKAFYAFVECVERNLNPFTTPLVVTDTSRGDGSIVLSVSPFLKEMGVPSRCRRRELPKLENMIYARPRMQLYIEKSSLVTNIILNFIGEDDIHIYSIDEVFINLEPYLKLYNKTPYGLVRMIQSKIFQETKLVTTAGISYNMFLAKVALDLDGKKKAPYITEWKEKDIVEKLWPIKPLSKVWGISSNYERKLNALGIYTIGELAHCNRDFLVKKFGIIGGQLHDHANGLDDTNIREKYIPEDTSFSLGQVLFRDYTYLEAPLIVKEMCDDLATRLRSKELVGKTFYLSIGYSLSDSGSFSHRISLDVPTNDEELIYNALIEIYNKHVENKPIRRIHIGVSSFIKSGEEQLSLFENYQTKKEQENLKKAIDILKKRYGKNIILRATSLLKESTIKERHEQIGGHHK